MASQWMRMLPVAAVLALVSSAACAEDAAFRWTSSEPVMLPSADGTYSVKDPSVVFASGRYHVFFTTADAKGWHIATKSFTDWSKANEASITLLDRSGVGPGYRAAPQVYYFAPQKLWYLIFQGGDPFYSTTANIDDPLSWSAPKPFFTATPEVIKAHHGGWLDFWNICDDKKCYLFHTGDDGLFYRSETAIDRFPNDFGNTTVVMEEDRADLFEASMTYKIAGTGHYITMIEAMGPKGRYFRAWTADRLDGDWKLLTNDFAGAGNVAFDGKPWSEGVSHGELIRTGIDQTMTVDFCKPLQFLYQGLPPGSGGDYIKLPYRLGLLTATTQPHLGGCGKK
ncbi:non-reducing end alpha-L-arabinofuranosidase family hydrolase [Rhizomicrobium electricum]|uniref:Alpha-L-arabinofuranosidase n=1 Tax=Rhizomicrobium electricum TaxID=480070 RepID=A0ABP3QB87_9PROT|nr:non-reducing end alpha-L-arabinofuranosidase family hydrolase [Rhizomicrobium electricum]NIJ50595.1 endo-1,4-beta-xylanase [Rhizomicrobium electricum]